MLPIILPSAKLFNEATEEYVYVPQVTLKFEHSLISLSKWESKWHRSYLNASSYTTEEFMDYMRCMSLDPNVDMQTLKRLTRSDINTIMEYMRNPMTATTFSKLKSQSRKGPIITAEIIYYWMISFDIPFECEKWHLNRLLTLIEVCSRKQNPEKLSKREAAMMRAAANEARRKQLGSKG